MSPALRDSFVEYAPNTVRKVHALDAEALLLQRRLEDEATHEAIRAASVRQAKGKNRLSIIEATRAKLGQQLASADREAQATASDTETRGREVVAAVQAARAVRASRRPRSP